MRNSPYCIGLLHSLTGTMAISEQALLDVEKLAIDEINSDGGLLGCLIDPVVADGVSDPMEFQRQAERLTDQGITQLFGCWTSASRKAVKPVVEKNGCLLWYPVQYEGLEESCNIIYSGACLNQQISPAVNWLLAHLGKRVFLLGSDYVFPQAANKLVKSIITQSHDAGIAGERYVPLGSQDFGQVIAELKTAQPEVIFNTLNGDSNVAFFKAYDAVGLAAATLPILSVSIGETEVQHIGPGAEGHYACWSYFQSLDNPENRAFMERFRQRFGSNRVCSAPMVMAYMQIYLWKTAVELAGSFAPSDILRVLPCIELNSPAGLLTMNRNHHLTKECHIGKVLPGGQFATVWSSPNRIAPLPWLGVERCDVAHIALIKDSMAAFTDSLHYSAMLKKETEERQRLSDEVVLLRERELRNSESFLEKIVENIPNMIFVKDAESLRFIRFNRAGEQLLGYSRDDLIGKSDYDFFPLEEADSFAAKDRMVLSSTQVFDIPEEFIKTRFQGERILHTKKISMLDDFGKPQFLLGISEDITDRRLIEAALKESEEQHRVVLETALDGFWLVDSSTGKLLEVNAAAASMLGYTCEELLARGIKDIDVQWSREEIDREMQKVKTAGKALFETQHLTKSGQTIDVEIGVNYLPKTDQFFSFIRNITERKLAEEELKNTILFNKNIIDSAQEGIMVYDCELRYLLFNPFMEKLTGLKSSEVIGKTPLDLFPFMEESGVVGDLKKALRGEKVKPREFQDQIPKSGRNGWVIQTNAPLLDSKGEIIGVLGIVRDITEQKRTTEQLYQSQKMESIGQLAGGLAHDFNNLLSVINGYCGLLQVKVAQDEQLSEYAAKIISASNRASELTHSLMAFSRKQVMKLQHQDLNVIVSKVGDFVKRIISENITFRVDIKDASLFVHVDSGQIEQVLINLATNARDAMPKGGTLTFSTDLLRMDDTFLCVNGFGKPGRYAVITAADTGMGMDEATRKKIFEPFFTTKEEGKGTGLGLAMAIGIVSQHKGYVTVSSKEGHGTSFTIYLPLLNDGVSDAEPAEQNLQMKTCSGTILVAEDDEETRSILTEFLTRAGYSVITAIDGQDAVEKFAACSGTIDLVIADVIMPRKSGKAACDEIRQMSESVKFIFISGHTGNVIAREGILVADTPIIIKPLLPFDLLRKIREIFRK